MIIFNSLPFAPDFLFFENKVENPIDLEKSLGYIQKQFDNGQVYESLESLFWIFILLYKLNREDLLDIEAILTHIAELKHQEGGFKPTKNWETADIWSTFYCITMLKILEDKKIIDDKDINFIINSQNLGFGGDGGFCHCNKKECHEICNGKSSYKSSFFALTTLNLLNRLNEIDKARLINYFKKDAGDDLEIVYQVLSLNSLGELSSFDLEKKIDIFATWKLPKTGFNTKDNFPIVTDSYWICLCLGALKKFDLIKLIDVVDFLKAMQLTNGGFTEQFIAIGKQEPNLKSTALGVMAVFYCWNELIDEIEHKILSNANKNNEIFLIPIVKEFLITNNLAENIASWMISTNWINGEILDKDELLKDYQKNQNMTSREIINQLLEEIKSIKEQDKLDLTEFSKEFDFSNSLERVKLVIHDLIIKKYIFGNILTLKKKVVLEKYMLSGKFLRINKKPDYDEISKEKLRRFEDKDKIYSSVLNLENSLNQISIKINEIVEQLPVEETRKELSNQINSFEEKMKVFYQAIEDINSSYKHVNFNLFNFKFEQNWSSYNEKLKEKLKSTLLSLEELINERDKYVKDRSQEQMEEEQSNKFRFDLKEIQTKITINQEKLKNFFPKNFTKHDEVLTLINENLKVIDEFDKKMVESHERLTSVIKLNKFKKILPEVKQEWEKELINAKQSIKSYQEKIDKRKSLIELSSKLMIDLTIFSDEKNNLVLEEIENRNYDEAEKILARFSQDQVLFSLE